MRDEQSADPVAPEVAIREAVGAAALGLGLVLIAGAVAASLTLALQRAVGQEADLTAPMAVAIGAPLQGALLLAGLAALTARSPDGLRTSLGLSRGRRWWLALGVLPAGALASGLVQATAQLTGATPEGIERLAEAAALSGPAGIGVGLGAVAFAPLAEELLFRGFIYEKLARGLGAGVAIAGAGALFAIYHVDPLHVVGTLALGLWLGWLRAATGAVGPCVLAHAINNGLWLFQVRGGAQIEFSGAELLLSAAALAGLGVAYRFPLRT